MNETIAENTENENLSKGDNDGNTDDEVINETGSEETLTREAEMLSRLSNVFRSRILRIKRTIERVYPELEREQQEESARIKSHVFAFKEAPNNEMSEAEQALFIQMLTDSRTPYHSVFIRGMFLSIFSEMDAYTEAFLIELFHMKPDIMLANQKQFSASEVFESDSIESFKKRVILKEVDSIKRESYIDQITYLENKFNINTLKNFPNWSKYVEITQRRNIVTHNDGIVSEQYIKVCSNNKVDCKYEVGEKLKLDYNYLIEAISIIEEVSIKLIHTLWRKCFPCDTFLDEFDIILNQVIFDVLCDKEWSLAKELGSYACSGMKPKNPEAEMMLLVNYCIALNNLNERDKTEQLLEKITSVMDQEFLLAKYVLLNDIENCIRLMKKIGVEGTYFKKESYPIFPLFDEIRKEEKFRETYREIFGEDINKEEIKKRIDEVEKAEVDDKNSI